MSNVWKIGSRWSEYGTWDSRIITIFRRSGVIFVGGYSAQRFFDEVSLGDYFAIAFPRKTGFADAFPWKKHLFFHGKAYLK